MKYQSVKIGVASVLPEPMQIAILSGLLAPDLPHREALEKAMARYIEALCLHEELPLSIEKLIARFGSERARQSSLSKALEKAKANVLRDALELDPTRDDDEARQFLAKRGIRLKQARSVMQNLRRYLTRQQSIKAFRPFRLRSSDDVISGWKVTEDGKMIYRVPRAILQSIAEEAKSQRTQAKRKAWHTRRGKSPA